MDCSYNGIKAEVSLIFTVIQGKDGGDLARVIARELIRNGYILNIFWKKSQHNLPPLQVKYKRKKQKKRVKVDSKVFGVITC